MSRWKKALLPIAVLVIGAAAARWLANAQPDVELQAPEALPPLVEVIIAERRDVPLDVTSQGTVEPRTESTLVAQVGGRIEWVSRNFAEGAFVAAGESLLQIERRDYELGVAQARAAVAAAEVHVQREEAEAEVAREEWRELGRGEPPPLVARDPQLAEARAALASARAALARVELDLERTSVTAPFSGRLRRKLADIGQSVAPGTPLATLFADDYAEIRLPVPRDQLGFLNLDLDGNHGNGTGLPVVLSAVLGGQRQQWSGRVVRTAGSFDEKTRMLEVYARVEDPFQHRNRDGEQAPLPMGLFVEARISGQVAPGAVVVPRTALTPDGRLMVVDSEDRLRLRPVELIRVEGDLAVIGAGLEDGERIPVSPLETPVDGMQVRTTPTKGAGETPELPAPTEERL